MEFTVIIHDRAEQDVAAVVRRAGGNANAWAARLLATIESLSTLPERCPLAAEAANLGVEIRELLFGKRRSTFRIIFRISGQTVHVLRVVRAAQDALGPDDLS